MLRPRPFVGLKSEVATAEGICPSQTDVAAEAADCLIGRTEIDRHLVRTRASGERPHIVRSECGAGKLCAPVVMVAV